MSRSPRASRSADSRPRLRALMALTRAEWGRQRRRALWPVLMAAFLVGATLSLLLQIELYAAFEARLRGQPGSRGFHDIVTTVGTAVAAWLLMLMSMAAAATTLSAERCSTGTLTVLASPFSTAEIVVGKFIGLLIMPAAALGLYAVEVGALSIFLPLDPGQLTAALGTMAMMAGLGSALGLFLAAVFREGFSALVFGLGILACLALSPVDQFGWGFPAQLMMPITSSPSGLLATGGIGATLSLVTGLLTAAGLWLEAERFP